MGLILVAGSALQGDSRGLIYARTWRGPGAYLGSFAERKKGAPEDFPEPTRKEDTNHKFHGWGTAANCLDREGGPRRPQRPQSQPHRDACRDCRRAPQARLWAACSASSLLFTHAISAVRSEPLARGRNFPAARWREPPWSASWSEPRLPERVPRFAPDGERNGGQRRPGQNRARVLLEHRQPRFRIQA